MFPVSLIQPEIFPSISQYELHREAPWRSPNECLKIPLAEALKAARLGRVLIVEDDECLKTVLYRVLHKVDSDVQCSWVTAAEQALEKLSKEKFDLVISDNYLKTNQTGLELWSYCRKRFPTLPFMLMSGMGVEKFLAKTNSFSNPPLFLPKPFRASECYDYLKTVLKGGFYV